MVGPAAAFAGEKDFAEMKKRIRKIAGFRPYRKKLCAGLVAILAAAICMALLILHNFSYARYIGSEDILVYEFSDGDASLLDYDNSLYQMISYDDSYVYVNREEFDDFLHRNHAEGEIYIVFGGCYKMPGLGSAAESCFYESNSKDKVLRIPYENTSTHWRYWLFKLL
ncbi:MAG: hypothetical protein K2G19_00530 [Lachnospiraceae bacterium]|nr:hypothetical protein [Lachnospiraceae bacterium]